MTRVRPAGHSHPSVPGHGRPLLLRAGTALTTIGALLAALAAATVDLAGFDDRFVLAALGVYGVISAIALAGLGAHPHARFGPANTITAIRAALTAMVAACLLDAERFGPSGDAASAWSLSGFAILILALDGVDGPAARFTGLASKFGARFDMEVDALLIFLLSLIAFASGKVAAFVLLLGAMRYLYLALHALIPSLPKDLGPSVMRKAICVVQVSALCAVLTPVVGDLEADIVALVALVLLALSFGRDLLAQARAWRTAS